MEYINKILDKFESFLKRAFLPSMVFYFFIIVFFIFDNTLMNKVQNILNLENFIWVFIAFSIGLSYFLNILHQLIFDNNIKENYDTKDFWTRENNVLKELREKVLEKLEKDELNILEKDKYNDYVLYQIIRRKVKKISKRYVDDAKTYGIVFFSFILALIVFLATKTPLNEELIILCYFVCFILYIIYILVFDAIKAKYRSRAIRLYINYITKKRKETKKETQ